MYNNRFLLIATLAAGHAALGCSSSDPDPSGTAGAVGSGTAGKNGTASGGATGAGGSPGVAGSSASGGSVTSGGMGAGASAGSAAGESTASGGSVTGGSGGSTGGATGGAAPAGGASGAKLVGYWPLDEATADAVRKDASGQGYDGTPVAAPMPGEAKFGAHGVNMNPHVTAIDPSHDQFAGGTQKIDLAQTMPPPSAPMSISVWIRPKAFNARQYLVGFLGATELALFIEKSGEIRFWRWDPKPPPPAEQRHPSEGAFFKPAPTPGVWMHLVATLGPAVMAGSTEPNTLLYQDGQVKGSWAGGVGQFVPVMAGGPDGWSIGAKRSLQYTFSGDIDEVRIYDRVLAATEVESLYTTNTLGP